MSNYNISNSNNINYISKYDSNISNVPGALANTTIMIGNQEYLSSYMPLLGVKPDKNILTNASNISHIFLLVSIAINPLVNAINNKTGVEFMDSAYNGVLLGEKPLKDDFFYKNIETKELKTFQEKMDTPGFESSIDLLLGHYCQPQGDYQRKANKSYTENYWKDLNNEQSRQLIEDVAIYETSMLPKDMIFLTFDLTSPESLSTTLGGGQILGLGGGTWTGHSFLVPNYIGPHHILLRLMKIFNIKNNKDHVKKFYKILKTIQRITFYNHPVYDQWQNGEITLQEAVYTISKLIAYTKKMNPDFMGLGDLTVNIKSTVNSLPYPSWGIKHRHGGDKSYTSVVFIGKNNRSLLPMDEHKKWCWLKNSDGYIYDGEYNPADMKLFMLGEEPVLGSTKINVGAENIQLEIKYYEMEWAGFQINPFDSDLSIANYNITDMKRAQAGYYPKYSPQQRVNINIDSNERNKYVPTYGGKRKSKRNKINKQIKKSIKKYKGGGKRKGEKTINEKKIIKFSNGDVYKGDLVQGIPNGMGWYMWDDERIYDGEWLNGTMHGKGTMVYPLGGDVYNGDWINGEKHGKGKYTVGFDGEVYEGDYVEGYRHGNGKLIYGNGDVYIGEFVKGKPHGKGIETYAQRGIYVPAGSTYDGYFFQGQRHTNNNQFGKLYWPPYESNYPDKSNIIGLRTFEGIWKNDKPITPLTEVDNEFNGQTDFSLENWGNYTWETSDNMIIINQNQGRAYEIHRKADKLSLKLNNVLEYLDTLTPLISIWKPFTSVRHPFYASTDYVIRYVKNCFTNILKINNDKQFVDEKIFNLDIILDTLKANTYIIENNNNKRIILTCVNYVDKGNHNITFKQFYVNSFIEDNINAYGTGIDISCSEGIFERFYTVLLETINMAVYDKESFEYKPEYDKLLELFGSKKPNMGMILNQFDDDENKPNLEGKSQSEKIRILTDYIKTIYAEKSQELSTVDDDLDNYLKSINVNSRNSLFNNPFNTTFGGKKKRKSKKKKLYKKNKSKKYKSKKYKKH